MNWPVLALEGCDGAGKSTLRAQLGRQLRDRQVPVFEVGQHSWLDPLTTRLIVQVRDRRHDHSPEEIAAAYLHDKRLHLLHNILPARASAMVVCDRCVISDAVYLEALYGIDARQTLDRFTSTGLSLPDVVVFVDVPVALAVQRIATRGQPTRHYERHADLERVRAVYERVLQSLTDTRVLSVPNHSASPEEVVRSHLLEPLLELAGDRARRP